MGRRAGTSPRPIGVKLRKREADRTMFSVRQSRGIDRSLRLSQEHDMASIAQVSRAMRRLFEEEAEPLARQEGLRQRGMRFHELAYLLVLGWWHQPQAGPSALARFGGTLGLQLNKQEVDCHFTVLTAQWLLALLRRGVQVLVSLPLVRQFTAVLVEDGSTISLPGALARVWRGCGGTGKSSSGEATSEAALKVTVRFDLL